MIIAHKIALDPNAAQESYFARACGTARFAYNWALAEWKRQYLAGEKPSEASLRRKLNSLKDEQFPWMREVTKNAPQQAIKNLGAAFKNFFAGTGQYPQFKKKGQHDSFRADNGPDKDHPNAVEVDGKRVKLPVIGWVKMREPLRFCARVKSAVVSRTADRWFVSLSVEIEHVPPIRENQAVVGVDLGIKALATLSDDAPPVESPKALRRNLKKLKRLSRSLSRKVKGSANRRKAKVKIARLHARIANVRGDALHKLTTDLVRRFDIIGIEDLNVRGMMANGHLARAVADVGMSEFGRQLTYKAAMTGASIVVADRWFPSSKTCADCGHVHAGLTLSDREWVCEECGVIHDRDRNAAINLMKFAASSAVTACGEEGSDVGPVAAVKPASAKQELRHEMLWGRRRDKAVRSSLGSTLIDGAPLCTSPTTIAKHA
jgi:putative transposase